MRLSGVGMLLAAMLVATGHPARAQPVPCTPAHAGARTCMEGSVCECAYESGGTMLRTPPGWHWQCSIMQMCDETVPAELAPPPGLPDGVNVDIIPGLSPGGRPAR